MCGRYRLVGGLAVAVLLIGVLLLSSGCTAIDKFLAVNGEDTLTSAPVDIEVNSPEAVTETFDGTSVVTLYFGHPDGKHLKPEVRKIPKVEGIARATIGELLKGAADPDVSPLIPDGTELRDINVRPDGTCVVDFSHQLLDSESPGSGTGLLAVYSIVDTLTEFPTVQQVEILVDGQRVDSSLAELDLSQPIARDDSLIKD